MSAATFAQGDPAAFAAQELQRQQERERLLREQQQRTPDVRIPTPVTTGGGSLPESENPSFTISRIVLKSDVSAFDGAVQAAETPEVSAT